MSNWTVETLYSIIIFIKHFVPPYSLVCTISTILDFTVQIMKKVNDMTTDLLLCSPGVMSSQGKCLDVEIYPKL